MPLVCCNLPFAPLSKATPTMTRALHMVYNDVLKHNLALGVQVCQCITWYLNLLSESLKTWCFFVSESLYTRLFCHSRLLDQYRWYSSRRIDDASTVSWVWDHSAAQKCQILTLSQSSHNAGVLKLPSFRRRVSPNSTLFAGLAEQGLSLRSRAEILGGGWWWRCELRGRTGEDWVCPPAGAHHGRPTPGLRPQNILIYTK